MCEICKATALDGDVRGKRFVRTIKQVEELFNGYWDFWLVKYLEILYTSSVLYEDGEFEKVKRELLKTTEEDEYVESFVEDLDGKLAIGWKEWGKQQEKIVQQELAIWLSFNINDEHALDWARKRSGELIKGIDEVTREEVSKIIFDGINESKPAKKIAYEIADKFEQYKGYRSRLIAQQEVSIAFSEWKAVQYEQYKNYFGVWGWKKAITQQDDKVRPEHSQNANEGWIAYDREFSGTGGMREPFGYNCRCVTINSLFNPDTWNIW